MEYGVDKQIAAFAFFTRLVLISFQFLANVLVPDHDAKVFDPPIDRGSFSTLDHFMQLFLGGFRRWDAIYFVHIAEHGYTYENCAAFFPLFPIIVRFLAHCLSLTGLLHLHTSILLVAVLINSVLFAFTAKIFYALGLKIGLDKKISFLSSLLFCVNPSSVFMTAPYSETLYLFLLLIALLLLKGNNTYAASIFVGLSIFTRSNGLIGIGFLIHYIVQSVSLFYLNFICSDKRKKQWLRLIWQTFQVFSKIFVHVLLSVIPFFLYQYYIYRTFCHSNSDKNAIPSHLISYGRHRNYQLSGDSPSPWCSDKIPLSYSYIQSHYWGVGFFKYYEFKQIPNFLLAAPVIFLSVKSCLYFFHLDHSVFYSLGLGDVSWWKVDQYKADERDTPERRMVKNTIIASKTIVFVFHLAFLVLFGCIFVHIQVLTRMLFSSTPLLYWYCGITLGRNKIISDFAEEILIQADRSSSTNLSTPLAADETFGTNTNGSQTVRLRGLYRALGDNTLERRALHSRNSLSTEITKNLGLKMMICVYKNWTSLTVLTRAIVLYYGAYFVIGTVMFSNFLPWT